MAHPVEDSESVRSYLQGMNENGNKYAEAALKERRAKIAGEIFALRKQVKAKLTQLATLDATLQIFDPDFDPKTLRVKRYVRAPLFGQGELGRTILGILREADGVPLAAHEIAARVMVRLGQPEEAKMAMTSRVRANLTYLKRYKGSVVKTGDKMAARWMLAGA